MSNIKTINFLHIVQGLEVGGVEVLLLQYIRSLGCKQFRHHVYCMNKDGPIRYKLHAMGVDVKFGPRRESISSPFCFVSSVVRLLRDLYRYIRAQNIDVIQSHNRHANLLGIAIGKLSNVPVFPTVHNTMTFVDNRSKIDPRVHLMGFVEFWLYTVADRVVTVSKEIREIVVKKFHLHKGKVIVLRNGIVLEERSDRHNDTNIEKKQDTLLILAIGSLTYQKAFDILLKAVDRLRRKGLNHFVVWIAGEGPERPALEHLIDILGLENHVKLLGLQNEVEALLKAADIFVLPSRYEGLSIAMIEAMAHKKAIVGASSPGITAYLKNNVNALVFSKNDSDALAECLSNLAGSLELRTKLGKEAGRYFKNHFDMKRNIGVMKGLIRKYVL